MAKLTKMNWTAVHSPFKCPRFFLPHLFDKSILLIFLHSLGLVNFCIVRQHGLAPLNRTVDKQKLQQVQNSAARILTGLRKLDVASPKLSWLVTCQRSPYTSYRDLIMMYKCLNSQVPENLSSKIIY